MFYKMIFSIFLFIFGSFSLVSGTSIGILFGPYFLLPASFLFMMGIFMYIKLYQFWKDKDTKVELLRAKNILYLLLLLILGAFFLNGLSSIWPVFIKAEKDVFVFGETTGGFLIVIVSAIGAYFLLRKILKKH